MTLPYAFSLMFFVACTIYFFYGLLIISNNAKSTMHWLLFLCCLDLALWAFSFTLSNSAPDYESCLFWRRVAAFGWGTFYSYLLHYILVLTERKNLLKKKWLYVIIYLPAVLNVFFNGVYSETARKSYNLVCTNSGWVNISQFAILDWFFSIYFIVFSLISIILIFDWGIKSKEKDKRKQANIIGISFLGAVIIGSMTEVFINAFFTFKVPQIAPIIILIPISVMLYCIKRYGFMIGEKKSREVGEAQILSEHTRYRVYLYLVLAYLVGGFVNFAVKYYAEQEAVENIIPFSLLMILFGFALYALQNLRVEADKKDSLSTVVIVVSIPVIMIKFFEYSAFYAWVIPVILMLVAIVLSKKRMLIIVGIAILITFLYIWSKAPVVSITFTQADHFARICALAMIFYFVYYVNRTFTLAITEHKDKILQEELLSRISTTLMTANERNIDEKINVILKLSGETLKFDRINLVFFSNDQGLTNGSYEWCDNGIVSIRGGIDSIEPEKILSANEFYQLKHEGCIKIYDVEALRKYSIENEWMIPNDIKSLILYPLMNKDVIIGIVCFEAIRRTITERDSKQEAIHIISHLLSDVWLEIQTEKELRYKAYYDILTGIPNREMFRNRLEQSIDKAKSANKLVGVMYIDLDSFKTINGTIGHDGGDLLLKSIGQALRDCTSENDTVSRFGGDEFLISIPQVNDIEEIIKIAQKIMSELRMPITVKEQKFHITVSIGVSVYPMDGENAETLIKNASLSMYISKEKGKNRYTMCSDEIKREAFINTKLTNDLYGALERNEFLLYYQPQVDSITEEIIGTEALIRWNHPEKGIIMPGVFMPLAEKTGLINDIGLWVLREACRQNKVWLDKGLPSVNMAVNLSLGQFLDSNLIENIKNTLRETELSPDSLELEITESIAIYDPGHITRTIHELKKLGVDISIDDFGTEYSSLSRFKTIPIDKLKIDMGFIHGMFSGSKDEEIIKVIIQLGKTFGIKVIAEGVENQEQLAFLKENLCDEIQGYYFYKPMPPDELEKILTKK